jgi:hypothetical protein
MVAKKNLTKSMALISQGINGAMTNPEVMNRLTSFGYGQEKMTEGKNLLDRTQGEVIAQQKEYGEQYSAYEAVESLWTKNQTDYRQTLDLCRIGLKNKVGALHSLRASGGRNRSLTGFIKDARVLYSNLLDQPELLEAMLPFGITETKLTAALDGIAALEAAYQNYLKERGEAQDSTINRDALFDSLYYWYSDFRAVARIALAGSPQLMEGLGIVVKR